MSLSRRDYCFYPGCLMVGGRKNPGILTVDKKFVYLCNSVNKEGNVFRYICQHRLTPGVKCIAKATVRAIIGANGETSNFLCDVDLDHVCEPNIPKVIADSLKHEMKEHMRNHPETTAGKIVRKVTLEASIKYGDDEDMWHHIVAELGP